MRASFDWVFALQHPWYRCNRRFPVQRNSKNDPARSRTCGQCGRILKHVFQWNQANFRSEIIMRRSYLNRIRWILGDDHDGIEVLRMIQPNPGRGRAPIGFQVGRVHARAQHQSRLHCQSERERIAEDPRELGEASSQQQQVRGRDEKCVAGRAEEWERHPGIGVQQERRYCEPDQENGRGLSAHRAQGVQRPAILFVVSTSNVEHSINDGDHTREQRPAAAAGEADRQAEKEPDRASSRNRFRRMVEIMPDPGQEGDDEGRLNRQPARQSQLKSRTVRQVSQPLRCDHEEAEGLRIRERHEAECIGHQIAESFGPPQRQQEIPRHAGDEDQPGIHLRFLRVAHQKRADGREPRSPERGRSVVQRVPEAIDQGDRGDAAHRTQGPAGKVGGTEQDAASNARPRGAAVRESPRSRTAAASSAAGPGCLARLIGTTSSYHRLSRPR